jgi:hypothetical protein
MPANLSLDERKMLAASVKNAEVRSNFHSLTPDVMQTA